VLEPDLVIPIFTILVKTKIDVFGEGYIAYNNYIETVVIMKPDQLPLLGRDSHRRKGLHRLR
jgi:hypothetical protein